MKRTLVRYLALMLILVMLTGCSSLGDLTASFLEGTDAQPGLDSPVLDLKTPTPVFASLTPAVPTNAPGELPATPTDQLPGDSQNVPTTETTAEPVQAPAEGLLVEEFPIEKAVFTGFRNIYWGMSAQQIALAEKATGIIGEDESGKYVQYDNLPAYNLQIDGTLTRYYFDENGKLEYIIHTMPIYIYDVTALDRMIEAVRANLPAPSSTAYSEQSSPLADDTQPSVTQICWRTLDYDTEAIFDRTSGVATIRIQSAGNTRFTLPVGVSTKKLTVTELSSSYDSNELAAEYYYEGQLLELSGRLGLIRRDETGAPTLALIGRKDNVYTALCHFDEADLLEMLPLSKGSKARIIGICTGIKDGVILLERCRVIK